MPVQGAAESATDLAHRVTGAGPDLVHGGADARTDLAQRVAEPTGQRRDDLGVLVQQPHDAVDDRHNVVEADLQHGLGTNPGDAKVYLAQGDVRSHVEAHEVEDLGLEVHVGPQVAELEGDLVHARCGMESSTLGSAFEPSQSRAVASLSNRSEVSAGGVGRSSSTGTSGSAGELSCVACSPVVTCTPVASCCGSAASIDVVTVPPWLGPSGSAPVTGRFGRRLFVDVSHIAAQQ